MHAPTTSHTLFAALVSAAILVMAHTARAYCLTTNVNEPKGYEPTVSGCWKDGLGIAWPDAPIEVRVDRRASRKVTLDLAQRVVVDSFAKWTAVQCEDSLAPRVTVQALDPETIEVSDCTTSECVRDRLAGAGAIVFRDDRWPHADGDVTFALTTVTYRVGSGRVVGAFMEINTADHDFVERGSATNETIGLDYVITHEAGHFLGLSHSDTTDSIMYSRHRPDGDASLRDDDRGAICAIRPFAEQPPESACAYGRVRAANGVAFTGFVALASAWLRRRRSRPRG